MLTRILNQFPVPWGEGMPPAVRVDARSLTARGERTRNRLVAAGEEIFGLRGNHDASIAEITQTASVA
jgi:AcrR family transcriptional regulator